MRLLRPVRLRPAIITSTAASMLLALACSSAIQRGHADVPIAETADEIRPLGAGDPAPRFTVRSVDGERVDFEPSRLDRPVVVIMFRGGWCPYCNIYLSELRHVMPEIDELDIDVLFLSGDRPAILYDSLKDETREDIDGLGYRILSDADANAAIAFGIAFRTASTMAERMRAHDIDIEASSISRHGVLPVPAVFAIDGDGMIRYAYTNADYKVRLPADEVLAVARELAGSQAPAP